MRRGNTAKPGTAGVLRVEARSTRLTPKLRRGDIAVLDHVDLDEATAQTLVARGVVAVVNVAPSTSGRYPNLGPAVLVEAGVPLLDDLGPGALTVLRDGRPARVDGDELWVDDEPVARGTRHDAASVAHATEHARGGVAAQLADLAGGALGFLLDEQDLLQSGKGLPTLSTRFTGRHVLLVGPAYGAVDDVRRLRRYRRRFKPLLVGVDGGADTLLDQGLRPDVAVGDPTTMRDDTLKRARDVVVRAQAEGLDRVHDLAVPVHTVPSRAASEDLALLLAAYDGATVVVTAGVPRTLEELLDRGRAGASSSLVTRFAQAKRVVSAGAAVALTPRRSWAWPLVALMLAGALATTAAFGADAVVDTLSHLGG